MSLSGPVMLVMRRSRYERGAGAKLLGVVLPPGGLSSPCAATGEPSVFLSWWHPSRRQAV